MVAGAEDAMQAQFDLARAGRFIQARIPDDPVALFRPDALRRTAHRFVRGFPGLVTYAVKANSSTDVLRGLVQAGITTFDVASVAEMRAVRDVLPDARLHYHNPIRSSSEIAEAKRMGVASWSVDRLTELDKLGNLPAGSEIAVRLTLKRAGGAYDFGAKFGATPDEAALLLSEVMRRGLTPALTFHPGTQCTDPEAWADYIAACAGIARKAGVPLATLNVGGGFPAQGAGAASTLPAVFRAIRSAVKAHFPDQPPRLCCEPGRAMVADAYWLLLRVKARSGTALFLNDGLYGSLGEWRDMPVPGEQIVFDAAGEPRIGPVSDFTIFGPTCDSLDRVPCTWNLPAATSEGDHLLLTGAGAYSLALVTGFNGYGLRQVVNLAAPPVEAGQCGLAG